MKGDVQARAIVTKSPMSFTYIDPETGAIIATTVTDAEGYYQVSVPPGGPYLLEAIKDGGLRVFHLHSR